MFDEDRFEKIVGETNYYARQKLADNEQRLGRWRDVCKPEVKAYFRMCVIMGMNILPKSPTTGRQTFLRAMKE